MIKIVSTEEMRAIEAAADAGGLTYAELFQRAGRAIADRVIQLIAALPDPADARVTILVGPGNNGGDGLVTARMLAAETNALIRLYLLKPRAEDDELFAPVRAAGLFVANADDDQRYRVLINMVASAQIVVDALFGIGIELPLRDDASKLMRSVHQAIHESAVSDDERPINPADPTMKQAASRPYVIAADCPSGIDSDSGALDKNAMMADETITFIAPKRGLLSFPGAGYVGQLTVAPLGVPPSIDGLQNAKHSLIDAEAARDLLPDRPADGHKGTFGTALIIGGSVNYTGAPGLAAIAAYRSGAGLVTVGTPGPVIDALAAHSLETTWLPLAHDMGALSSAAAPLLLREAADTDALLLGPGWGREKTTRDLLSALLESRQTVTKPPQKRGIGFATAATANESTDGGASSAALPPLVIDADGLNLLGEITDWAARLPEQTILTPHPGEMARLAGVETAAIQAERWRYAAEKAAEWRVILVLKGAHTLIADPDGEIAVLPFKTSALATAGTGDVLAGVITGLVAQGLKPYAAAIAGGYLHGLAGAIAARRLGSDRSVIASDVLAALPAAWQMLDGSQRAGA
ncbi:MAG: bifunctional ADP-dependent NAD(P)H-hydrate dehydratase/NAD(P)H-hydrate epimerase [Chloroflexi bacterium]|nr:bifunctional ADP-dependent NAD(P)H-hydrate dehydratase/NAD(P)H-hydrate epimerase [Chloroflexota bacterium]